MKRITLEELSAEINVSRTTLYKVLNNKGNVSERTHQKVLESLKRYNYVPNLNARDLAHSKQYPIAYIGMDHVGARYFRKMTERGMQKAQAVYSDNGLALTCRYSDSENPGQQIDDIDQMLEAGVKDFIITPSEPAILSDKIKELRKMGCRILYLSRYVDEPQKAYVGVDYYQSGCLAAEMLSKMLPTGGKTVILLYKTLGDDQDIGLRYAGFVDYVNKHKTLDIVCVRDKIESGVDVTEFCENLLKLYPDMKAIYDISYKTSVIADVLTAMESDQSVKLAGFDIYDEAVPYIKSSAIDFMVGQSLFSQAYEAVEKMFKQICYGMEIEPVNYYSRLDVIVSSNVDYYPG